MFLKFFTFHSSDGKKIKWIIFRYLLYKSDIYKRETGGNVDRKPNEICFIVLQIPHFPFLSF